VVDSGDLTACAEGYVMLWVRLWRALAIAIWRAG
jgi:hypothetical protein